MTLNKKMLEAIHDAFLHKTSNHKLPEDEQMIANECEAIAVEWANEWIKVDYDNPPKGDVLLLTTSKVIAKGYYWKNHCGEWGFRTEQSTWGLWGANEKECLSVLKPDDIIGYHPLPEIPKPSLNNQKQQ